MKPADLDKSICEFSIDTGHSFTEIEQARLVAKIWNDNFSDGNVHTMPDDNTHLETIDCWCMPQIGYKGENDSHIIHNSNRQGESH